MRDHRRIFDEALRIAASPATFNHSGVAILAAAWDSSTNRYFRRHHCGLFIKCRKGNKRIELSSIAINLTTSSKANCSILGNTVPFLPCSHIQIIQAMPVVHEIVVCGQRVDGELGDEQACMHAGGRETNYAREKDMRAVQLGLM